MSIQQVFKQYQVITAESAVQMGLSVSAMLLAQAGWQLASPMMCTAKPDGGVLFYVSMMQFEIVHTPDEVPAPKAEEALPPEPVEEKVGVQLVCAADIEPTAPVEAQVKAQAEAQVEESPKE